MALIAMPLLAACYPISLPEISSEHATQIVSSTRPQARGACPQYENMLREYAPPKGWDIAKMSKIMWRESRCIPTAQSRTSDSGLLQINRINHKWLRTRLGEAVNKQTLENPVQNIQAAALLCAQSIRSGYSCYRPWGMNK
jgi:hypothetical protein